MVVDERVLESANVVVVCKHSQVTVFDVFLLLVNSQSSRKE